MYDTVSILLSKTDFFTSLYHFCTEVIIDDVTILHIYKGCFKKVKVF